MTALLISLMFVAGAAVPPDPPDSLTLDQAIAEALRAEPGLRTARAELDASRGEHQQAAVRPNPEVSFEQREQAGGADRQTSVAVELPLDLFRRGPRIESAERMVVRADAAVRDRERLLAAAVRERYGDALVAARRLEVLDAVVGAARRTFELLANRVTEGAAPPLDRDVALVELRRLEGQRSIEAGRVAVALSGLKVLLGRAPSATLSLADTLEGLAGEDVPADLGTVGDRADIQAAAADLDVARSQTSLALQERKPELNLFGSYMRMDAGFPQSGLSVAGAPEPIHGVFHNVAAGVKVTIPLFNRGQGTIAAARARETAAAEALSGRRLGAAGEIGAATARLEAARAALTSYAGDTRSLARRNLDVVRETYTLGRAGLLEVMSEQRRYLDFEAAYTEALAEAFAALTDLQRAKGAIK
jgi:outer membrane protein, heavy metal efflux system